MSPTPLETCDAGDRDPLYGIMWSSTAVNSNDNKPCPPVNSRESVGTAFRFCQEGKRWSSFVNVSNCQTSEFRMLTDTAVSESISANVMHTCMHA